LRDGTHLQRLRPWISTEGEERWKRRERFQDVEERALGSLTPTRKVIGNDQGDLQCRGRNRDIYISTHGRTLASYVRCPVTV
jgi:hypothetical protein